MFERTLKRRTFCEKLKLEISVFEVYPKRIDTLTYSVQQILYISRGIPTCTCTSYLGVSERDRSFFESSPVAFSCISFSFLFPIVRFCEDSRHIVEERRISVYLRVFSSRFLKFYTCITTYLFHAFFFRPDSNSLKKK